MAHSGRGIAKFIRFECSDINAMVIRALKLAMEPSLKEASLTWNGEEEKEATELFRHQML